MKEMTEQEAFRRLSTLCARAEHCEYDLLEKMRRWELGEEARAHVMDQLTKGRYVDNRRYAEAFVREKVKYNKWGRRKVEQALWAKHIDENIIREALDGIDPDDFAGTLKPLLQQKRRSTRADSPYEMKQKLIRFALSRGFTYEEAVAALEDC